jgi:hypothetical protein
MFKIKTYYCVQHILCPAVYCVKQNIVSLYTFNIHLFKLSLVNMLWIVLQKNCFKIWYKKVQILGFGFCCLSWAFGSVHFRNHKRLKKSVNTLQKVLRPFNSKKKGYCWTITKICYYISKMGLTGAQITEFRIFGRYV